MDQCQEFWIEELRVLILERGKDRHHQAFVESFHLMHVKKVLMCFMCCQLMMKNKIK
jgi:hypothetical protein